MNNSLLPPQDINLEESILGTCLQDVQAYLQIAELLSPECFYKDTHYRIWEAIQDSFKGGRPIDSLSITHFLRQTGYLEEVGGPYAITTLTNRQATIPQIKHHALLVKQMWMLREIINCTAKVQLEAYRNGADPFELMTQLSISIDSIGSSLDKAREISLKKQLDNTIKEIEEAQKNDHKVGKSTGFKSLDKMGGLVNGDLIVLAARPGMGKSALGVQIAVNVAMKYQEPIIIFELEMTHTQLWKREISRHSKIAHSKIRGGDLDADDGWKRVNDAISSLRSLKIELYDVPRQQLSFMRRKLMQCVQKHGKPGLVVLDFLQLAEMDEIKKNSTRAEEVGKISRGLKILAKEFDVPLIAIASLSRETEKRKDKRPVASDLRESGSIESDADKIWLMHRPDYYDSKAVDDSGNSLENVVEIHQPKNRSGDVGKTDDLRFDGETVTFYDHDPFVFNTIPAIAQETLDLDKAPF